MGRSFALILIPVYTRSLGLSEYGTLEMLMIIVAVSGIVLNLGMDSAQTRFFFKADGKSADWQKTMVGNILKWRIIWSLCLFLLIAVMLLLLGNIAVISPVYLIDLMVCLVIAALAQVLSQGQQLFRLTFQPWKYVIFGTFYSGSHAVGSILLLWYTDLGLYAVLLSLFVTSSVFTVVVWRMLCDEVSFRSSMDTITWRRLLYFGGPISVGGVMLVLMNVTDKLMIAHKLGPEDVAIYAIADKVVLLALICVKAFKTAWQPYASKVLSVSDLDFFRRSVSGYFGTATAGAVALTAAAPTVVSLLAPPEYSIASDYVAWLVWHGVFFGGYIVVSIGFWKSEQTASLPLFLALSFLINIALNYILIDVFGGIGAAMATSISFAIWILLCGYGSERRWRVGFPVWTVFLQLAFGMSVVVVLVALQRVEEHGSAVAIALVAVTVLCLSGLRGVSLLSFAHLRRFRPKRD